jgi:hypothetical protein
MPLGENWSEELVAEWLQLEGYLIEIDLPAGTGGAGGRFAPDVVGARIGHSTKKLEIVHVEVGSYIQGVKETMESFAGKFSPEVQNTLEAYFKERFAYGSKPTYRKMVVASYSSKPVKTAAQDIGIEFLTLDDFICARVLPTIRRWKESPYFERKTKGENVTLSDSLWILKLLDYLDTFGLLKCKSGDDAAAVTPS